MFPELRPFLEEVFDQAEPGTGCVITRYRDTNSNLRTQLQRIIRRAGLKPRPKLFQNLRSTRQTELEELFPSHVVCAWVGNSKPVAAKNYLQVTDEHIQEGVKCRGGVRSEDGAATGRIGSERLARRFGQRRGSSRFARCYDQVRILATTISGAEETRTPDLCYAKTAPKPKLPDS